MRNSNLRRLIKPAIEKFVSQLFQELILHEIQGAEKQT